MQPLDAASPRDLVDLARYPLTGRHAPGERVRVLPMTPGTLVIFAGLHSLHRVSPVVGTRARQVALLAYDTRPDADSSDLFKRVRYGRSASVA
jgi:hypothetical protein